MSRINLSLPVAALRASVEYVPLVTNNAISPAFKTPDKARTLACLFSRDNEIADLDRQE